MKIPHSPSGYFEPRNGSNATLGTQGFLLASFANASKSCLDISDCRTLSSIICSCVATLAACTWVSVHPNVPNPDTGQVMLALRRLKLMLLAIIAPEIIVLWALRQRMVAKQLYKDHYMSTAHGFFVSMGGFVVAKGGILNPIASHTIGQQVDHKTIREIEYNEILDRSKGDEITKGLAMLQTAWFMAQCIARRIQHLPLTELEVVTLAFSFINVIIYIIWWNKPQDVRHPIRIGPPPTKLSRPSTPMLYKTFGFAWGKGVVTAIEYTSNMMIEVLSGEEQQDDIKEDDTCVPTLWAGRLSRPQRGTAATFSVFLAVAFGGIHFMSWSSYFPTHPEQTLWRVATIIVVAVPSFFFLHTILLITFPPRIPEWLKAVTFYLVIPVGIVTYTVGRVLLIVLPFISLRSLPVDAYKDIDWTKMIPHVS